ncbi:DUF11 domain-containing protein [Aliterella atlantica]|uniref:Conserved repeat protein n=1 Tax=Aliterella atlantica CENA595 TaxID=1618023 RepID=A0A0D8ZSD3_9CYAN|nr:DUF11 domain-containing protein [Aliterella atlantica]KJH70141.1 conserved repeat protein [Aliterella atlantica CENA595]
MKPSTTNTTKWFGLLTTALLVGGVWQSTPVLAQEANPVSGRPPAPIVNQVSYSYTNPATGRTTQGFSELVSSQVSPLVDPLGQVTGCAGETLPDYTGFSVGIYEIDPSDPTGTEVRRPLELTVTELPNNLDNSIPAGITPNTQNSNPYFLTSGNQGTYSFLFDPEKGQLDAGRAYILLINPPANSTYNQRRVRLVIGQRNGNLIAYTATSLDSRPINTTDNRTSVNGTIAVDDAERVGLVLAALDLDTAICQAQELQIVKTGDRAAAEPGDTVIYRLAIRNLASSAINNVVAVDTLPLGFDLLAKSVRGELGGNPVTINASHNGSTVTFRADGVTLPGSSTNLNSVLNIAYAAVITPDAVRGRGLNSAIAQAQRQDNSQIVRDGPATHRLRLTPGILSDCGTIIGRVFVDKNFDGEQQSGEPGVPNAVIFMDDGNRITTDPNGLFSVANVISGYRTGVLDLSSLPGYTLAPNRRFIERNSQSRLVHLEPGGLVRMNFAVTPAFGEVKPK